MRKLTYGMNLSLDGYIAAPGDDIGWSVPSDELFGWWTDRMREVSLSLYGRKLWETMSAYWPTADQQPGASPAEIEFARLWQDTPKVVFSSTIDKVDGNTRLCTATAAAALKESFASDGQPGSYTDVDHADVVCLFGHNMAETQTVLWSRILDRLAGPDTPAIVCVDPRLTPVAEAATVHLAPRPGTNVMLMNALIHEIIANGWVDPHYIAAHAVGFEELAHRVEEYTPEVAGRVCDVPADQIRRARG